MGIRVYKPTSPARRLMSVLTFEELTKKAPEKSLTTDLRHRAGRNNQGKITVRHQGGGPWCDPGALPCPGRAWC